MLFLLPRCKQSQFMTALLSSTASCFTRLASSNAIGSSNNKRRSRRSRSQDPPHHQLRPLTPTQTTSASWPPSPLLVPLHPDPAALTRAEALDRVLADLEASIGRGAPLDLSVVSSLVETCSQMRSLVHGLRLRRLIPASVILRSADLSSKFVRLYSACGRIEDAHLLFDEMSDRNKHHAFPWNSLISGYVDLGFYEDAMALYHQMEEEGVGPDEHTFPRVLKACAGIGSIQHGEAVHRHLLRCGFGQDSFVLNALVDMYSKCGDIQRARKVFDSMTDRDRVSWNSMLVSYIRYELPLEACAICRRMVEAEIELDYITVSAMLSLLSSEKKLGLEIHGWVLRRALEWEISVANSMITMYSERGRLDLARWIFAMMEDKDLVSWNAIINGHRRDRRVLTLFQQMEDSRVLPDQVTFVSLLSACSNLGLVEEGKRLFSAMEQRFKIKPGMEHYGCLVNLLGRAGSINEAYELVTKSMPFEGGATVWGALLYACSLHGEVGLAEVAAQRLFELEPDNELNFELLMRIYWDAGKMEEVERVRRLMKVRGLDSKSFQ